MTITTAKAVHDRFGNKIPNFLEHLPVWNDTPMSEMHLTPVRYLDINSTTGKEILSLSPLAIA